MFEANYKFYNAPISEHSNDTCKLLKDTNRLLLEEQWLSFPGYCEDKKLADDIGEF